MSGSPGMLRLVVAVLAAGQAAALSCFNNPLCQGAGSTACKNALNRFEDNGVYNGVTTYAGFSGDIQCGATFNCNSAGKWMEITGKDLKNV